MSEKDKPVTADDIEVSNFKSKHHPRIRDMLRRHKDMWDGTLGSLKLAEDAINLKEDAKSFISSLY